MITRYMHERAIERVREIYVAVFPVHINERQSAEVILAGYQQHPQMKHMTQIRATVETQASAVEDLVALCDRIVVEQEEIDSYRLLKFDQNGMHVLRPDDFRIFKEAFTDARCGFC